MKRLAGPLFLLATVVVLYRKAIRLWWMYDDAWLLHVALARRWTMTFTEGDTWHHTFTPLLDSTFEALLAIGGLEPARWHAVDLVLLAVCAVAIYVALHLYVPAASALAGAFLFVAGAPVCTFATRLMLVHYLEAILFGTIATTMFVLASRRSSNALNLLSAIFYLAAMLAKEIVTPLPLLLLVLPERNWRVRARHLVFHVGALAGYLVWRRAVVGSLLSGYGWAIALDDIPRMILTLPWKIVRSWSGSALEIGLVALALIACGVVFALRTRSALVLALLTLVLAVAPVLPSSKEVGARLTLVTWLWFCALFALGMAKMKSAPGVSLFVAAAIALLVANRQEWAEEFGRSERMSAEARTFMVIDGASLLRTPAIPPAAMIEFQWLKEEFLRRARGSGWFYDDYYLCGGATLHGRRVYEYHPVRREVLEVTARIPDLARAYCTSIRDKVPLRAEFRHRRDSLFWRFGPYAEGRWRVVLGGGLQAFDVPREDGFSLPGVGALALRVRYQSPDGWVTYSPELNLEFAKKPELTWARAE